MVLFFSFLKKTSYQLDPSKFHTQVDGATKENTHLSVFIKSLGFEVWQYVKIGWSVLTKLVNGETVIKPMSNWNCEERKVASRNFIALHVI